MRIACLVRIGRFAGIAALFNALVTMGTMANPSPASASQTATAQTAFDFTFEAIDGGQMPLANFRDRVLLVVNTASFCGFTKQYEGLQKLHETYGSRGLVVIGVPSNDFGEQEPKAEGEIASFCRGAFGVTFPLTSKQTVKGDAAHPFYVWARRTFGEAAQPRWNFHKVLVGRSGQLKSGFGASVTPTSRLMIEAIEAELARTN